MTEIPGGREERGTPSLHCHHQNDSCIKMGSDESRFNVSLIVRDKVTRQRPQTSTFEERGDRSGIETAYQPIKKFTRKVLLVTLVQLSQIQTKVHRKFRFNLLSIVTFDTDSRNSAFACHLIETDRGQKNTKPKFRGKFVLIC